MSSCQHTYVCHTWHEKAGNYWNINLPVYTRTYILCIYSIYTVYMYTSIMQIAFSTYLHMKLKGLVGFYIVFIAQNRHAHHFPLPPCINKNSWFIKWQASQKILLLLIRRQNQVVVLLGIFVYRTVFTPSLSLPLKGLEICN